MQRCFFDVVRHGRSELDFAGRELPTPETAYDASASAAPGS